MEPLAPPPPSPHHAARDERLVYRDDPAYFGRDGRPRLNRRARLSAILFGLTCVSTFLVGFLPGAGPNGPINYFWAWYQLGTPPAFFAYMPLDGLIYAGCVMTILLAHEAGHFVLSLRHGVPATFPFFLPFPISPFGTMGAVIVQQGGVADRRQMFDIAVAGPLAGLVVTLPVLWYGVAQSALGPVIEGGGSFQYGNPLLLTWIVEAIHGPIPPGHDIGLNAPLFAGWVGLFITALNLLPVGQLDGGHILYTLIGRRAHAVAYAVLAAAVAFMLLAGQPGYLLFVVLLLLFGPRHPPTRDDTVPLGLPRVILGWATLAFFVIGFTPTPIV